MKTSVILGTLGLGLGACAFAGCSSDNKTAGGTGGTSAGGNTSTGGSSSNGGNSDSGTPQGCPANVTPEFFDGGLTQVGYSEPTKSVTLGDGGYYEMPNNSKYHGHCFTFADGAGSTIYPPCGDTGPCFTVNTGLCMTADLGVGSATTWGAGFGCNLNEASTAGAAALFTDVIGMSTITASVYGCSAPPLLQVQLNVVDPPVDSLGVPGSGYFCNRTATWSKPDADGNITATVQLTDLTQDCWNPGGVVFDPATMHVKSIQGQINAVDGKASTWDFCLSRLSIE